MSGPHPTFSHLQAQFARATARPDDRDLAFLHRRETAALREAAAWDELAATGSPRPPLFGTSLAVKACFDVAGWTTTAASRVLSGRPAAPADAPIVAALRRNGAVVTGQTNMTEFAFGGLGPNPHFGTPRTPLDPARERIAGGSTSGGAVAVACGFADLALGSDTSGSVRIPAAFCGLVGFKPSQGRYPTQGLVFLSPSFDVPGFIAADVATCAAADAALTHAAHRCRTPSVGLRGRKFLIPRGFGTADLDEAVGRAFERVLDALSRAGAILVEQDWPDIATTGPVAAEGGVIIAEAFALHRELLAESASLYDPRVGPRIAAGEHVSAHRYYATLERLRALGTQFQDRLRGFDALLTPTVPFLPPRLQDLARDEAYHALNKASFRLTEVANRIDSPSISVPIGAGQPVGLLLTGRRGADPALLDLAGAVEPIIKAA